MYIIKINKIKQHNWHHSKQDKQLDKFQGNLRRRRRQDQIKKQLNIRHCKTEGDRYIFRRLWLSYFLEASGIFQLHALWLRLRIKRERQRVLRPFLLEPPLWRCGCLGACRHLFQKVRLVLATAWQHVHMTYPEPSAGAKWVCLNLYPDSSHLLHWGHGAEGACVGRPAYLAVCRPASQWPAKLFLSSPLVSFLSLKDFSEMSYVYSQFLKIYPREIHRPLRSYNKRKEQGLETSQYQEALLARQAV